MKPRLYLVIENYNRELESRIYLSLKAANLGWSVVIGNKANIFKQIKNLKSGIFFIKSVGPRYIEIIDLLKKYGNKVVATDEENIVFFSENHLLTRMNKECLRELDYYYCWGKREFDYLCRLYPEFKTKFIITGNPRIDVIKKPLNQKNLDESFKLKKKKGDFILLNSGFGKVIRASKTDWVQDSINAGKLDTEEKIQNEKRAVQYEADNLKEFVKLTNFLLMKLPNQKFILRPHPSEDDNWWRETFKSKNNLEVNTDKISTNVFIGASRCLIAHNCITLLEAYHFNKQSLNFIFKSDKRYEHELINQCSHICSDKNDILKIVESNGNKDYINISEEAKKNISYSIYNSKIGVDSTDKIIENLNIINKNISIKNTFDKNIPKFFFLIKIRSYLYKFYNFLRVYYDLIIKKDKSRLILHTISKNKRGVLTVKDVKDHLSKYRKILQYEDNFKVFELHNNLFCIESKKSESQN